MAGLDPAALEAAIERFWRQTGLAPAAPATA
jgi:hypothetical protein